MPRFLFGELSMSNINWFQYPNFQKAEFDCLHCGQNDMKPEFLEKLQLLRTMYGKPMVITSGYRCPQHPIEVAKSAPGPHATGLACDIGVQGAEAHHLLKLSLDEGFKGIGIQQKGSGRFLHLDLASLDGRLWSY